ncbi:MAG: hypothetical protein ACI8YQ_003219 [Polaribacter sp.]|jgi:hypothetical protein
MIFNVLLVSEKNSLLFLAGCKGIVFVREGQIFFKIKSFYLFNAVKGILYRTKEVESIQMHFMGKKYRITPSLFPLSALLLPQSVSLLPL